MYSFQQIWYNNNRLKEVWSELEDQIEREKKRIEKMEIDYIRNFIDDIDSNWIFLRL